MSKILLKCVFCGAYFSVKKSLSKRKYCTKKCYISFRNIDRITSKCFYCSKKIERKKSSVRSKKIFCNRTCFANSCRFNKTSKDVRDKISKSMTLFHKLNPYINRDKYKYVSGENHPKPWLGKKQSEETKLKIKNKNSGENHPNWRGGLTGINKRARGTADFKTWKKSVLERDNKKCIWCGSKENIEVDHIKPFSMYIESRFDINNGRTLCKDCHKKTDTYGGKIKHYIKTYE